jgi:hypothetical protein
MLRSCGRRGWGGAIRFVCLCVRSENLLERKPVVMVGGWGRVEKGVERREKGRSGSRGEDARRRARVFVMLRERMRITPSYPTPTPILPHRNTPHHPLFRPPSPPNPIPPGPASPDEPHALFPLPFTIRLRAGALAKVHTPGENERGLFRPTRAAQQRWAKIVGTGP